MKTITTKYYSPGNVRGARIVARDGDNQFRFSYNDALNYEQNHASAAQKFCDRLNWRGRMIGGQIKNGTYVWVFDSEYSPSFQID